MGWSQIVFTVLFAIFAVGLPLAWPSASLGEALAKLAGGAAFATCAWLTVVYLAARRG